jgi:hypothetical protein
VIKVKAKVFLFLGHAEGAGLHLSVKLAESSAMALLAPLRLPDPPIDMLRQ